MRCNVHAKCTAKCMQTLCKEEGVRNKGLSPVLTDSSVSIAQLIKKLPPSLRSVAVETAAAAPNLLTDQPKSEDQPQTARAPLPGERWPNINRDRSERWQLPLAVWRAIARRDDWTCRICHVHRDAETSGWQIDHIVPWSAGGSDDSTNLRLTCTECNRRRSNYFDPFARPMPPVITTCPDEPCDAPAVKAHCAEHRHWVLVAADYARKFEACRVTQELWK